VQELDERGWFVRADVVDEVLAAELAAAFATPGRPGTRDGLACDAVRRLAASPPVCALVESILGPAAFAFRATLFDKTPAANWLVAWHQDRVVPLAARTDEPGFTRWSQKGGTVYAEPPAVVLRGLLAVRVDLDGSGPDTGGLRVLSGTHRDGVLAPAAIAERRARLAAAAPVVPARGALVMRPLLLHASPRANAPRHRRIVHLELAPCELPGTTQFRRAGGEPCDG
jgi:hypothetical protein